MTEITRQELRAKNILLAILISFVIFDIFTVIASTDYIIGICRVILTIALIWSLMAGYKWAKWLTVILSSIASIIAFSFGVMFFNDNSTMGITFLLFGIGFLSAAAYLICSPNINGYFNAIRQQRNL